jgi:hypothetical protein
MGDMTSERYHIDKLFNETFRKASVKPDAQVWNRINSTLNRGQNKRRRSFLWLAAASFALLIAFGSGYFIALNQMSNKAIISQDISKGENTDQINQPIIEQPAEIANSYSEQKEEVSEITKTEYPAKPKQIADETIIKTEKIAPSDENETIVHLEKQISVNKLPANLLAYSEQELSKGIAYDNPEIAFTEIENNDQDRKSNNRWTITGQAAPLYSYRDLRKGNSNIFALVNNVPKDAEQSNFESDKNYYNEVETPLLAFSGGINTAYKISKRFSVESGIYFSRMGQVNTEIFVMEEEQFYGSSLQVINSSAGDVKSENHDGMLFNKFRQSEVYVLDESVEGSVLYQNNSKLVLHFDYLEVPLMMKYRLFGQVLCVSLGGGLTTSFLVNNSAHILSKDSKIDVGETQDIRSALISGLLGISVEYKLTDKINFSIEPQFKQAFSTVNNSYYIENFPRSISVFSGIKYNF